MTPMIYTMVIGTTKPQKFQLTSDGLPFNATDYIAGIVFTPTTAHPTLGSGLAIDWDEEEEASVAVTHPETLPLGRHKFRFTVEDEDGNIEYSPNRDAAPHTWVVVAV